MFDMAASLTRNRNGSFTLSDIVKGNYYKKTYYDYSVGEARADFRQYVKDEQAKIFTEQRK